MHKVIGFAARIAFIAGGAMLLILLGAALAPPPAPSIGQAQTIIKGHTDAELKAAFDRGMGAGEQYQEWFCTHTVSPSAPTANP